MDVVRKKHIKVKPAPYTINIKRRHNGKQSTIDTNRPIVKFKKGIIKKSKTPYYKSHKVSQEKFIIYREWILK